jgi:hypothetical protein
MTKATTDDIAALCSRIDAQTVIMIELAHDDITSRNHFRKRYDILAEKFRDGMIE